MARIVPKLNLNKTPALVESNSLILIDEPENSSHPNCQMSYIGWLQKIFKSLIECLLRVQNTVYF